MVQHGPLEERAHRSVYALLYGLTVAATALNPPLMALALLALAGGAMTISNASANTLLQRTARPRLRGQTASYMLAMRGGRSVGDIVAGLR